MAGRSRKGSRGAWCGSWRRSWGLGRFASELVSSAMAEVELTEEMIVAAMAKADAIAPD
jgi:hypothetical protein